MSKGQTLQDPFLNALRKDRIPVSIFLVNGIKLQGQIESFDQYVVLLKNTVSQMVYKHAISTVVPARNPRTGSGYSGDDFASSSNAGGGEAGGRGGSGRAAGCDRAGNNVNTGYPKRGGFTRTPVNRDERMGGGFNQERGGFERRQDYATGSQEARQDTRGFGTDRGLGDASHESTGFNRAGFDERGFGQRGFDGDSFDKPGFEQSKGFQNRGFSDDDKGFGGRGFANDDATPNSDEE